MTILDTHFASHFIAKSADAFFETHDPQQHAAVFTLLVTSLEDLTPGVATSAGYTRYFQLRLENEQTHIQVSYRMVENTIANSSALAAQTLAQPWRAFFKLSVSGLWPARGNSLTFELQRLLPSKARLPEGRSAVAITLGLSLLVPDIMAEPRLAQATAA